MIATLAALTLAAAPAPGVHEYKGTCSKESFTASAPLPITARPARQPVECGSLTVIRLPGKDHATFQLADPAGNPLMAFDGPVRGGKVLVGHYLPRPMESYVPRTGKTVPACDLRVDGHVLNSVECTAVTEHDGRWEAAAVFFDAADGQPWR